MVISVNEDSEYNTHIQNAGTKLVVVDFYATWCGPCKNIAPFFEELATKYPNAVFLKVDVEKCSGTAETLGILAMPTFIFYKNGEILTTVRGATPSTLEEKVKQYYSTEDDEEDTAVRGHMDLTSMIFKSRTECLNASDDHTLEHALTSKEGYLESDCDEQLIIALEFSQPVKLHSMKISGPVDSGPKNVKLFLNQPNTIDFDSAESMECVQKFQLTTEQLTDTTPIPLRYVKFQNVQNINVFIKDNQEETETTIINQLAFYGSPVICSNMGEFKRVAGKKGESE